MALVTGKSEALRNLAQLLAPGRSVKGIYLDFAVKSIAKATVVIEIEESDMPAIIEAAKHAEVEIRESK